MDAKQGQTITGICYYVNNQTTAKTANCEEQIVGVAVALLKKKKSDSGLNLNKCQS